MVLHLKPASDNAGSGRRANLKTPGKNPTGVFSFLRERRHFIRNPWLFFGGVIAFGIAFKTGGVALLSTYLKSQQEKVDTRNREKILAELERKSKIEREWMEAEDRSSRGGAALA
jgi:hypothetical protein